MRRFLIPILLILASTAGADEPTANATPANPKPEMAVDTATTGLVTISSKGKDVRDVLTDLFTQAKRNFVLDGNVRVSLYLALTGVEFDETLQIVCKAANLEFELQNGIYFVAPRVAQRPASAGTMGKPEPAKPKGKLPESVLSKKITTRFAKTDIRDVIKDIGRQTNLRFEVATDVPKRLVDAFLIDTSLRYGLDLLTTALGLEYVFSDAQSIVIKRPNPNRVVVLDPQTK